MFALLVSSSSPVMNKSCSFVLEHHENLSQSGSELLSAQEEEQEGERGERTAPCVRVISDADSCRLSKGTGEARLCSAYILFRNYRQYLCNSCTSCSARF